MMYLILVINKNGSIKAWWSYTDIQKAQDKADEYTAGDVLLLSVNNIEIYNRIAPHSNEGGEDD